jgi:ABC-type lipoprotein release transport system permease subunit
MMMMMMVTMMVVMVVIMMMVMMQTTAVLLEDKAVRCSQPPALAVTGAEPTGRAKKVTTQVRSQGEGEGR